MSKIDHKFKDPHSYPISSMNINNGKNDLLKLWKKNINGQIRESLFEQAIKFIYAEEFDSELNVEQLLLR